MGLRRRAQRLLYSLFGLLGIGRTQRHSYDSHWGGIPLSRSFSRMSVLPRNPYVCSVRHNTIHCFFFARKSTSGAHEEVADGVHLLTFRFVMNSIAASRVRCLYDISQSHEPESVQGCNPRQLPVAAPMPVEAEATPTPAPKLARISPPPEAPPPLAADNESRLRRRSMVTALTFHAAFLAKA